MTDVTETLANQADLRLALTCDAMPAEAHRQIDELTTALAARDRFIALVGHELRNALAPMVLLAEQFTTLAEGSQPPARLYARIAMLTGNLNKLMSTVGRIAEVVDLRRGKLYLETSATDLAEIVEDVCRELQREATAGGALLVIGDDGPVVGRWDRARVKQIVSNLISNAIRYGGGGRVEVSVRCRGNESELIVQDHGPGIDPAVLSDIFDLGAPGAARRTGFGIGLWVVKTLCSAMHGSVTVENSSPAGARFCVVLPRG